MSLRPPVFFQEEYVEFATWVRDFSAPYADKYLQYANTESFPWDMAQAMGEAGLLGLGVSEEFGGGGRVGESLTYTHFGILQEELAYANFYLSQMSYSASIMGPLLDKFLESEDKAEWVEASSRASDSSPWGSPSRGAAATQAHSLRRR